MPYGERVFSQGACLLTDGTTTLDSVRQALEANDFEVVKQAPAAADWQFGGPTFIVSYLPEVNGYVAVDVVNRPWPDSMGDPKSDSTTFGAWSMGNFGPYAFPGGLDRAAQQSWTWPEGRNAAKQHRGFIRFRMGYSFGAKDDDPIMPEDYDSLSEMIFLSEMVLSMSDLPGVICHFNPNGEVLRDLGSFHQIWMQCAEQEKIPLLLWMNVRYFHLNDQLIFMDSVGNAQLDIPDVEAIVRKGDYDPNDIDYYLRNVTHYLLGLDRDLKTGEEIDGPGESNLSWTMESLKEAGHPPPRRVLRLYPKALRKEVQAGFAALKRQS